ncbi:hypothetical protein [Amycolatopsis sp. WAC 01416]|uniref:hypothetical protein n=1 Tax=Amycolatopsis sp. WAC 01416 TaxID=2203196 RepID=UPI000F7AFFE2|nr:hypothetical protein [Amycolatopsis sp. WAC 01416]
MIIERDVQRRLALGRRKMREAFWSQHNVVSIGVGARQRREEWTDEPAITVGVVKKRKPGYLRSDQILPTQMDIDGVTHRVDVVETGEITFAGKQEYVPPGWTLSSRYRPLQPGIKIANRTNRAGDNDFYSGTLGGFVTDKEGKKYILSNHHVLMNMGTDIPVLNQDVIQPDTDADTAIIGRNYSYIELRRGVSASNVVDAALCSIDDQSAIDESFPGNRMIPINSSHRAIGLYFASNSSHQRGWICRINPILNRFGVSLGPEATHEVDGYNMFDPIEKVGARTGYSSTQIVDVDAEVKVTMSNGKVYNFENIIGTERMGWGGDSGAIVCLGGDGNTLVPLKHVEEEGCAMFTAVGRMYDLPLQGDTALGDRIRDEFLSQTRLGGLLTHLFYLNAETVMNRARQSATSAYEKASARSLYDKYRNFVESALNNPRDPAFVMTQENLSDIAQAINGAALHMTTDESNALGDIYRAALEPTLGMRYDELLAHMNNDAVYQQVLDRLIRVPTIATQGVIRGN